MDTHNRAIIYQWLATWYDFFVLNVLSLIFLNKTRRVGTLTLFFLIDKKYELIGGGHIARRFLTLHSANSRDGTVKWSSWQIACTSI